MTRSGYKEYSISKENQRFSITFENYYAIIIFFIIQYKSFVTFIVQIYLVGMTLPETSPKPTLTPSFSAQAFMVTVSLSLMNFLSSPLLSLIGFWPLHVSSSMEPNDFGSLPEMVPLAYISPTSTLQPFTVW